MNDCTGEKLEHDKTPPLERHGKSIGMEWFRAMPTVWDDTKVLSGEPGESVIIARRHGESWFAGAITNNEARTVTLSLDMLDANQRYTAWLYTDGEGLKDVRKSVQTVHRDDLLKA